MIAAGEIARHGRPARLPGLAPDAAADLDPLGSVAAVVTAGYWRRRASAVTVAREQPHAAQLGNHIIATASCMAVNGEPTGMVTQCEAEAPTGPRPVHRANASPPMSREAAIAERRGDIGRGHLVSLVLSALA